jgi:hypothetical protein
MVKRVVVVALLLLAVFLFSLTSTPSVRASSHQKSIAAVQCWQDNCDGRAIGNCTIDGYEPSFYVVVLDGYNHQQGALTIAYSGATHGCMTLFGWFSQNSGESLKSAEVGINRYQNKNDNDLTVTSATFNNPSGPHDWYSPMVGFEGNGEDCVYAYINIVSNNGTKQSYQTSGYCPN